MSKLVDKERLAKLAAALDQRAKTAVQNEADRATAAEQALQTNIDAINNPTTGILAKAKEHVAAEIKKVNAANDALDGRVGTLEADVADHGTKIAANTAALGVLNGGVDKVGSVAKAVADAKNALQGQIDAVVAKNKTQDAAIEQAKTQADKGVTDAAAVAARATKLEADVADHNTRIADVKKVADANKAAIGVLNGNNTVVGSVDKKISDALASYTDTDELKVMLGNVVNSLAISMEENKLKLKLGGVEGITIHETSLEMATDKDIEDIIAGLDA